MTTTRLLTVLLLTVASSTAGAQAASGLTQSVVASTQLPALPEQTLVEMCLNDDCVVVALPETHGADLGMKLSYRLVNDARLPNIAVEGGLPRACQTLGAGGAVRERMGVAIEASKAKFADGSALQLEVDGKMVTQQTSRKPTRTDAVSASVCLL